MNRNDVVPGPAGGEMQAGDGSPEGGEPGAGDKPGGARGNGPRNPWQAQGPEAPRRSAGIEDIFRSGKGGGPGGRGPGGGWPKLPVGDTRGWLPWAAAGVVALWLLTTSVHQLNSTEQGIVTTFGKYTHTIDAGLSLTAPWPIQKVKVADVTSIRRDSIPDTDGEKLMLTSDQNLVDLSYLVRWNIKNLKNYTFQLKDPDGTIREVAEAAMRATVAEVPLGDVMGGSGRAQIEQAVRTRMQAVLDAYRAGVLIQGVDIKKADPPEKVNAAYQQVSAAQQEARRDQSKAQAYAASVVARAQGDAAAFDAVYAQYKLAPEVTRRRMYYETMEKILSSNDKVVVDGQTTSYLPLPEVRRRAAEAVPPEGQ
ncbi:MAG: protease modulator HflK [Sphingomonadales bacterium]|nr:protease modulator HflK [Sphingomonadales bacterium]